MTVSDIDAVDIEIRIAGRPEAVFAYLIDPDKMVRWMGAHVESDPRPGGADAVDINDQARARGRYVEVVPHSRIVFTFGWEGDEGVPPGSSTVEMTLTPDRDGTLGRLVHRGLLKAAQRELHRDGWQLYLARLSVAASGAEPGRDPNANAEETHGR